MIFLSIKLLLLSRLCFCENLKNILYYTSFFDEEDWAFGFGREPFRLNQCEVDNCYITNDKQHLPLIEDYDALLFHVWDMPRYKYQLPQARTSNQTYIFFSLESPIQDGFSFYSYENFFNWSMTYRPDSNLPLPYGFIKEKFAPLVFPEKSITWTKPDFSNITIINKQKRLVSWVVSKCITASRREEYVDKLRQFIPIHQFGACNNVACDSNCYDSIWQNYKFYLAFENSDCNYYVTEKFWNALANGVVPIVYGGADYSKIAPPHSFINAKDFSTPEKLAEYFHFLDNNDYEYSKYHWWRKKYTVVHNRTFIIGQAMCNLCKKLQNPDLEPVINLADWWKYGQCSLPATTADWFSAETTIGLFFLNRQKFTYSDYMHAFLTSAVIFLATLSLFVLSKIKNFNKIFKF